MRIKITTNLKWPIERQIPSALKLAGVEFTVNSPIASCDAWIVYQGLNRPETCEVREGGLVFFGYEPPLLHNYNEMFLKQFDHVVTCQATIQHPSVILRHQAQPWLAGLEFDRREGKYVPKLDYQGFLNSCTQNGKDIECGVVCSGKDLIKGHLSRRAFVQKLHSHFGDSVQFHGTWQQDNVNTYAGWSDKWPFISRCKRLIVLENSRVPHYWTEKLSDAYLANCFPIYHGCTNLGDYFEKDAYVAIDCEDHDASIAIIEKSLESELSAEQINSVNLAKKRVLDEYNLFAEILRIVNKPLLGSSRNVRLSDERLFMPGGIMRKLLRPLVDSLRARR